MGVEQNEIGIVGVGGIGGGQDPQTPGRELLVAARTSATVGPSDARRELHRCQARAGPTRRQSSAPDSVVTTATVRARPPCDVLGVRPCRRYPPRAGAQAKPRAQAPSATAKCTSTSPVRPQTLTRVMALPSPAARPLASAGDAPCGSLAHQRLSSSPRRRHARASLARTRIIAWRRPRPPAARRRPSRCRSH